MKKKIIFLFYKKKKKKKKNKDKKLVFNLKMLFLEIIKVMNIIRGYMLVVLQLKPSHMRIIIMKKHRIT